METKVLSIVLHSYITAKRCGSVYCFLIAGYSWKINRVLKEKFMWSLR